MTQQTITISNLEIYAKLGLLEHELIKKQKIIVNAKFNVEYKKLLNDNDITSVLDYRELRNIIIQESTKNHTNLVESLLEKITQKIIMKFPEIVSLNIKLEKPEAFGDCIVGLDFYYNSKNKSMLG